MRPHSALPALLATTFLAGCDGSLTDAQRETQRALARYAALRGTVTSADTAGFVGLWEWRASRLVTMQGTGGAAFAPDSPRTGERLEVAPDQRLRRFRDGAWSAWTPYRFVKTPSGVSYRLEASLLDACGFGLSATVFEESGTPCDRGDDLYVRVR